MHVGPAGPGEAVEPTQFHEYHGPPNASLSFIPCGVIAIKLSSSTSAAMPAPDCSAAAVRPHPGCWRMIGMGVELSYEEGMVTRYVHVTPAYSPVATVVEPRL